MAAPAPVPRPVATLAVLAVICVAATLYGARDIVTWAKGLGGKPVEPAAGAGRRLPPPQPQRVPVTITGLGAIAGVALRVRSRRGRPGGGLRAPRAATAAAPGRRSRPIRCGGPCCSAGRGRRRRSPARTDASSAATSSSRAQGSERLGEIQAAAEWTGSGWRAAGLSPVAPDGTDTTLDEAVGYDAQGQADRRPRRSAALPSGTVALPGRAEAFAADHRARCTPRSRARRSARR